MKAGEVEADVLVIGGGFAGAVAALTATERGERVTVISRAYGATALSSGAFDMISTGVGEGAFEPALLSPEHPEIALEQLFRRNPFHPYAVLTEGLGEQRTEVLLGCFDACGLWLNDCLRDAGFAAWGRARETQAVPTQAGTWRLTQCSAESVRSADFFALGDEHLIVIGIEGLAGFDAAFVVDSLRHILRRDGGARGVDLAKRIKPAVIGLRAESGLARMEPFALASRLEEPPVAEALVRKLKALGSRGGATRFVFPPVLGIDGHPVLLERIRSDLGVEAAETLSAPPHSTHGLRLQRALARALESAGVGFSPAAVKDFDADSGGVCSVQAETHDGPMTFRAKRFVLASGSYLGGGLKADPTMREPLFSLPLFVRGREVEAVDIREVLRPRFFEAQPAFSVGVRVDSDMRPVDAWGKVIYENLYAAGSILADYDPIAERCGMGVALITGYRAGGGSLTDGPPAKA